MSDDFTGYLTEQFAGEPQEQEDTPEPVAETAAPEPAPAAVEAAPAEPEQELILGKYKTPEEAFKALEHAQRRIGELGNEVGQLRQQVQPEPQKYDLSSVDESIADNPQLAAQAATLAWQQGDTLAYERIVNAWGEVDPFGAARFDARVASAAAQQQALAQIQPTLAQTQQYAARERQTEALTTVAQRHQDFAAVVGGIDFDTIADQAQDNPVLEIALNAAITNGDTRSYQALFETLYLVNRQTQAVNAHAATAAANTAATQQATAEKQKAVVASASSPQVTEETGDKDLEEFYDFFRAPSPTSWADLRPAGQ